MPCHVMPKGVSARAHTRGFFFLWCRSFFVDHLSHHILSHVFISPLLSIRQLFSTTTIITSTWNFDTNISTTFSWYSCIRYHGHGHGHGYRNVMRADALHVIVGSNIFTSQQQRWESEWLIAWVSEYLVCPVVCFMCGVVSCGDMMRWGTFVDNHDNPRFLNSQGDYQLYKAALTYVLMSTGIPIIYYGEWRKHLSRRHRMPYAPSDRPLLHVSVLSCHLSDGMMIVCVC